MIEQNNGTFLHCQCRCVHTFHLFLEKASHHPPACFFIFTKKIRPQLPTILLSFVLQKLSDRLLHGCVQGYIVLHGPFGQAFMQRWI